MKKRRIIKKKKKHDYDLSGIPTSASVSSINHMNGSDSIKYFSGRFDGYLDDNGYGWVIKIVQDTKIEKMI